MNEKYFLDWCKDEVFKYTNEHLYKTYNNQIDINLLLNEKSI